MQSTRKCTFIHSIFYIDIHPEDITTFYDSYIEHFQWYVCCFSCVKFIFAMSYYIYWQKDGMYPHELQTQIHIIRKKRRVLDFFAKGICCTKTCTARQMIIISLFAFSKFGTNTNVTCNYMCTTKTNFSRQFFILHTKSV